MTNEEKIQIKKLRADGFGYKKIASMLGISLNTIKSFCRQHQLTSTFIPKKKYCRECGTELLQTTHKKTRIFCSNACKTKWWNTHRENRKHTIQKEQICLACHQTFIAYPHERRKYCSHACYIKERFKGGDANV